jgi:hypothetical protein
MRQLFLYSIEMQLHKIMRFSALQSPDLNYCDAKDGGLDAVYPTWRRIMSANNGGRHPFLDDLTVDAELTSTVMRRAVSGRENIKKLIAAVDSLYKSQTPTFFGTFENRSLLQYAAELGNGKTLCGVAIIERNPDGGVPRVSVTFSPIDSAMSLAARLGSLLEQDLGPNVFL